MRFFTKNLSSPTTTTRVLDLLRDTLGSEARIADVGAGRGHFSRALSERLRDMGLTPVDHLVPCDMCPEHFQVPELECLPVAPDGCLPFADASMDAVVSIEVIEHVEDQFAFLRELARVTKPGGLVIVTTPNVLNLNSRVRNLVWGFPCLYDLLPLDDQDIRFMGGHIHPISPYYLAYTAMRAELTDIRLCSDRTKHSAIGWAALLGLPIWLARRAHRIRIRRKRPHLLEQNASLLPQVERFDLLTGRTAILSARRPAQAGQPHER